MSADSPGPAHVYGPVASRRLGRSLGIDVVPFKTCTYDCIYCQLGRTTSKTATRRRFFPVSEILAELSAKLAAGAKPDYLCIAGSGEPTLYAGLGELISSIKSLSSIPLAIITNGSLLWMQEVRDELMRADVVMPSLDAGDNVLFHKVNRPHKAITFDKMTGGLIEFSRQYRGRLWLEVFVLQGIAPMPEYAERIAVVISRMRVESVQLGTVMRPPAESAARAATRAELEEFARVIGRHTRVLPEMPADMPSGGHSAIATKEDILAIVQRHPSPVRDIALALGIHVNEAVKMLDRLCRAGSVVAEQGPDGRQYFRAALPGASRTEA